MRRPVALLLVVPALALAAPDAEKPAAPPTHDAPSELMPDRHWDVTDLHLDLSVDLDARALSGTATLKIAPLGAPTSWLELQQAALDVHAVRVDGQDVKGWRLGHDSLSIPMPAGGGARTVAIDYAAHPETGLHWRDPRIDADETLEVWSQGEGEDNRYWFPSWDYPNDRFTVSQTITASSKFVAVANGLLKDKKDAGGKTTWTYALDQEIPNYLVVLCVGDYHVVKDTSDVPLEYVVPKSVDDAAAKRSLGFAGPEMAWFGQTLGTKYPWPIYRQVLVSRFLYGAMENASTTTVDYGRFVLRDADRPSDVTESVVAHELAHQWFGDLLTCYGWRNLWLNEGFATYWAGRWMAHAHGPEHEAAELRNWAAGARADGYPIAPLAWSKHGDRENGSVYDRGGTVLHMLRVYLGDDVFDAGIRTYVARNQGRFVESDDLRRALEDVSGTHLGWFFDQWVHGAGQPKISASHRWKDGQLTVTLQQTTDGQAFEMPVDVEVGLADDVVTKRMWLGDGRTELVVDAAKPPLYVAVDPRQGVLADWDVDQDPQEWLAQAEHSPSPAARLDALAHLGDGKETADAVAALRKVALGDHDPAYKGVAITALGTLGGDEAADALLQVAKDPDLRVRAAAAAALGKVAPSASVAAKLESLATTDAAPEVRAAALEALAAHDEDRALALARKVLAKPDPFPRQYEHTAALHVLGDHGADKDLSTLLAQLGPKVPRPTRSESARAAVKVFGRMEDRDQEKRRGDVSRAIEPMLNDLDLRERQLGVNLLGEVGDDKAEARLEALGHATTVEGLSKAALDAAKQIRERGTKPKPTSPEQQADDAKRLQEKMDELEKRIEKLEQWK